MRRYATTAGPVAEAEAAAVADTLLRGRRRPHLRLATTALDGWWQFRAHWPEPDGGGLDALYVHAATGALAWSWTPLTVARLAGRVGPDRLAHLAG